jgi:signal transduction histidine kinase
MNSKMNFNTTELSELSQEILAHIPDSKKESLLTELHRLDDELAGSRKKLRECRKNELMSEILPVIFHKMKNKLTPIVGYSQILQTKIDDERQVERIKKIEKNADELAGQFNLIRDRYAIEKTGKVKGNLNDILSGLKPHLADIVKGLDIAVEWEMDPDIPVDNLYPGQIELLIANMMDNAVLAIAKKNTAGGIIEIKTKTGEDAYSFSIKDNGAGMEKEDIPKIWTPFFSRFANRAGIGLTLCEKIINNHEASFTVDSAAGEFSEFVVIFKRKSETNGTKTYKILNKLTQEE